MACSACFDGLFRRRDTSQRLAHDVVAGISPHGRRRFDVDKEELTLEEVLALVRPRQDLAQVGRKDIDKSWASPVPRSCNSRSSPEDAVELDITVEVQDHSCPVRRTQPRDEVLPPSMLSVGKSAGKHISKFQAEQLLSSPGTLPRPMSTHEREQTIRKLLPTATHEMLSRLPRHLVEAQGLEGQTLRRRLVNGATVVFFTAGYVGKKFVFERARQLGVRTVVIEHPDSWAKGMVAEGLISKFIPLDMGRSSEVIMQDALEVIKSLGSDGVTDEADAILTMVELSVPIVARLCEQLGLPGPTPLAVDQARDKHATRACLKAHGLPNPRNFLIHGEAELQAAGLYVGFPAVLKPISGAASLGVKKVDTAADLSTVYEEVKAELGSLVVVSGALTQDDGSGSGIKAETTHLLLEQYLDGQEVDIDVVVSEGEWRYAAISDNGPTVEPWFNETWGNNPSLLPLQQQRELKELAVACVKALGFDSGVFHVECKYTSTGPQLVEVNARMGGGPVHEHNFRTWGVDLVEEAIFVALGIPSRPAVPDVPIEPVGYYNMPAEYSGTVESVPDFSELCRTDPNIIYARSLVAPGDKVVGPEDGLPTWIVDVMMKGPTAEEALAAVLRLVREYPIKVKSFR